MEYIDTWQGEKRKIFKNPDKEANQRILDAFLYAVNRDDIKPESYYVIYRADNGSLYGWTNNMDIDWNDIVCGRGSNGDKD